MKDQPMTKMSIFAALALVAAATPVLAADEKPQAALDRNDPDAVRCRKFLVTGSLVKKERVCKTNAEWRAISEQQNRDADNLIERSRSGMNPNG
jgi:hypothetical protein